MVGGLSGLDAHEGIYAPNPGAHNSSQRCRKQLKKGGLYGKPLYNTNVSGICQKHKFRGQGSRSVVSVWLSDVAAVESVVFELV